MSHEATGSSLDLRAPGGAGSQRQDWTLVLPAADVATVNLTANAGTATLDLAGASVERFDADINAGDLRIDAGEAGLDRLDVSMNAGSMRRKIGRPSRIVRISTSISSRTFS